LDFSRFSTDPQCATVKATLFAEKNGAAGASKGCSITTDAVAPQV